MGLLCLFLMFDGVGRNKDTVIEEGTLQRR